jgi:hypothetical protein
MKHIKKFESSKFTESLSNTKKVEGITITYFDLFPLLRGLESERPGIKERIWKWLCDEKDSAFAPYNGRILNINLFYYGVGEEYPLKDKYYEEEVKHSKKIHPEAFQDGKIKDIRLDLNLIWQVYEDEISDPGLFPVITQW